MNILSLSSTTRTTILLSFLLSCFFTYQSCESNDNEETNDNTNEAIDEVLLSPKEVRAQTMSLILESLNKDERVLSAAQDSKNGDKIKIRIDRIEQAFKLLDVLQTIPLIESVLQNKEITSDTILTQIEGLSDLFELLTLQENNYAEQIYSDSSNEMQIAEILNRYKTNRSREGINQILGDLWTSSKSINASLKESHLLSYTLSYLGGQDANKGEMSIGKMNQLLTDQEDVIEDSELDNEEGQLDLLSRYLTSYIEIKRLSKSKAKSKDFYGAFVEKLGEAIIQSGDGSAQLAIVMLTRLSINLISNEVAETELFEQLNQLMVLLSQKQKVITQDTPSLKKELAKLQQTISRIDQGNEVNTAIHIMQNLDLNADNAIEILKEANKQLNLVVDDSFTDPGSAPIKSSVKDISLADTTSPSVVITSAESLLTASNPFNITITFSEAVTGFALEDLTLGGATATNLTETIAGQTYTVAISPTSDPVSVTINIAANKVLDAAGNGNTSSNNFTIQYDSSLLTVAITTTESSPTNTNSIPIVLTFSEPVAGFENSDLSLTGATASTLATADDKIFTTNLTPTADGTITLGLPSAMVTDKSLESKQNQASATFTIIYDSTPPTIASVTPEDSAISVIADSTIEIVFSEAMNTSTITANYSDTSCSGTIQLSKDEFTSCIQMSTAPVISNGDRTFTLTPASSLESNVTYKVKVTTVAQDKAGNNMAEESIMSNGFTTEEFTPAAISDAIWFAGDSGITLSNGIASWASMDGNKTLSQNDDAKKPSSIQVSGEDTVDCAASGGDYLENTTESFTSTSYTILITARIRENDTTPLMLGTTTDGIKIAPTAGGNRSVNNYSGGGSNLVEFGSHDPNAPHSWLIIYNGTTLSAYEDDFSTDLIGSAETAPGVPFTGFSMGSQRPAPANVFNGYIKDLIIIKRAITAQEKTDLETWATARRNALTD